VPAGETLTVIPLDNWWDVSAEPPV
jgi:hypothetical protein